MGVQIKLQIPVFNSFGYIPKVKLLGDMVILFLFFEKLLYHFSQWLHCFTFHQWFTKDRTLYSICYFLFCVLQQLSQQVSHCCFDLHFLNGDIVSHFMCLLAICVFSCVYSRPLPILKLIHLFSCCCWVVGVLYIFWMLIPYWIHDLQIFSPTVQVVYSLSIVSFDTQFLLLMQSNSSIFSFVACALVSYIERIFM